MFAKILNNNNETQPEMRLLARVILEHSQNPCHTTLPRTIKYKK